jgi:hypothetical protein
MHLAQINIARLQVPIDDPQVADFVAQLDSVNALADESPGFVWRLKGEAENAAAIACFGDPMLIVNLSVWQNVDALRNFAFGQVHASVMRRRREWFESYPKSYLALWWIPEGHIPTAEEAKARLEHLDQHGDTEFAFTFRQIFSPIG